MKAVIITLALASLASAATVDAQILGTRLPTPSTRGSVDGSWRVVGRDGNGNTIYERQTQDRNGNIIVQQARRDGNGNMSIISTRTVGNNDNRNRGNCDYNRTTNTVGDIIFGRTGNVNCDDRGTRNDGGWYQVGNGRDNNSIYERRTRDSNGNLVIQRARRNSDGTFTILSSRVANGENDKEWRKDQKRQEKEWKKSHKRGNHDDGDDNDDENGRYQNGNYQNDNYQNDNYRIGNSVYRGDDRYNGKGNGRGKGNGKGKHKGDD
ncbi:MAG TPA: hypothetical protein VD771_05735 [Gemmatimonadaceae bacterium]|nr:hypothetical protein [Gemmatimonadaceae bacterium]